jgi:FkbM family methyltransferase
MTLGDLRSLRVSYAQNAEDVLLERAFPGSAGLYVDIGANDPVFHSVTKRFYDRGWRGVSVEPNPRLHRRLVSERDGDANLNLGVGNEPGVLTFFEFPGIHGWSTFVPELAAHYKGTGLQCVEHAIEVKGLAAICAEHVGDRVIDFLKIDVEGFETRVIASGDWSRWRPRAILMERNDYPVWEPFLLDRGYRLALDDGINRYYARDDEPAVLEALSVPVNILDQYVSFEHLRLIESILAQSYLERTGLRLHDQLRGWANRHPKLKKVAKKLMGRAA